MIGRSKLSIYYVADSHTAKIIIIAIKLKLNENLHIWSANINCITIIITIMLKINEIIPSKVLLL